MERQATANDVSNAAVSPWLSGKELVPACPYRSALFPRLGRKATSVPFRRNRGKAGVVAVFDSGCGVYYCLRCGTIMRAAALLRAFQFRRPHWPGCLRSLLSA